MMLSSVVTGDVVLNEFLLAKQHSVFAMDRHDKLWPDSLDHDLDVFLRGVAGNVNEPALFLDDVRAAFV